MLSQQQPSQKRLAIVVILRGVNVAGHRTFRPSILAEELHAYDVVNIGAAGTLAIASSVSRQTAIRTPLPVTFPAEGQWLVRVIAAKEQFVFGMYEAVGLPKARRSFDASLMTCGVKIL